MSGDFSREPFARPRRVALFLGLLAACAFVRLWDLGAKTMMHDELLFAIYTYRDLYRDFTYAYLPILHGPLMLHLQNLVFHVFGVSDVTVRLGVAFLGIGGFFWIFQLRHWLGEAGTWLALGFYAIAPGIAFFHRFLHMDALYMFCTLWIVASLANWWRTGNPRWAVSAIFAITALFCNKASSLFLYFSLLTFALFLVIQDTAAWVARGKGIDAREAIRPVGPLPSVTLTALLAAGFVILVLTQVFEGLRYEGSVRDALGHDWVLRDERSVAEALGWGGAPAVRDEVSPGTWRFVYTLIVLGSLGGAVLMRVWIGARIGRFEMATRLWRRVLSCRLAIVGALAGSLAFYLAVYTMGFLHPLGPFEIFGKTWAYWGGQHEIGRIAGPFHLHMVNLLVYELPAVLVIVGAWVWGLARAGASTAVGVAYALFAVGAAGLHVMIFAGKEFLAADGLEPVAAWANPLRPVVAGALLLGLLLVFLPRLGRVVVPGSFVLLIVYAFGFLAAPAWQRQLEATVHRGGEAVEMMGGAVGFRRYMEVQLNFDGGWSIFLVLVLIGFAVVHTWWELDRGRRFRAFLVWWFVTMLGAASYAREAVPQVGIHAMLPAVLLAAAYAGPVVERQWGSTRRWLVTGLLAVAVGWNTKALWSAVFLHPDDPRERIAYGPSNRDVKAHMDFVREYAAIAPLRMDGGRPATITDPNDRSEHKDVRILVQNLSQVSMPAEWYLRDLDYTIGGDVARAIDEEWEFLFIGVEEAGRHPRLLEEYRLARGRGTTFWTPNPLSMEALGNAWKLAIPGHRLDNSPQAGEAFDAKAEWNRLWRYLMFRETFDGAGRQHPSVSTFEYLFCYRKDLF